MDGNIDGEHEPGGIRPKMRATPKAEWLQLSTLNVYEK
jgi:hypothetical protein